jgi:hypothetical protein
MRENVVAYFHFKWTKNRGAGQVAPEIQGALFAVNPERFQPKRSPHAWSETLSARDRLP